MIWRTLQFLLVAGALLMARNVQAQTRPFVIGGETVMLERAENSVGAYLRAFRPNFATGRWDVDVTVTNGSSRILRGPIVLRFDTATQTAPGVVGATLDASGLPFLNLTAMVTGGEFQPGQALQTFTLSLGDGRTRPTFTIGIYSAPQVLLAATRTLTEDGLPLEGVVVEEIGPSQPRSFVSGRGGWMSLETSANIRGWRFTSPGRIPVIRLAPSGSSRVTELASPRMVTSSGGTTIFSAANIPAPIPSGWSPLAAALVQSGAVDLTLSEQVETGVLAQWDEAALAWRASVRFKLIQQVCLPSCEQMFRQPPPRYRERTR